MGHPVVDACSDGLGAVLLQQQTDLDRGRRRPRRRENDVIQQLTSTSGLISNVRFVFLQVFLFFHVVCLFRWIF